MLFKVTFSILALASAVVATSKKDHPPVFTAIREYKTLTDIAPYIVTATTTLTWTQSPTTSIAAPTGSGV
ncbi:hypothetical protein K438DRAFT_1969281 [Mycena galopus ATCC 62051]|nr:hypothetical protein K438DRAFT_1969281 [Mycena galopus ATCC 62051]